MFQSGRHFYHGRRLPGPGAIKSCLSCFFSPTNDKMTSNGIIRSEEFDFSDRIVRFVDRFRLAARIDVKRSGQSTQMKADVQ